MADTQDHLNKIMRIQEQDYVPTNYPTSTRPHVHRHNFHFVENEDGTAEGTFTADKKCMICNSVASPSGRRELFKCDGQMNGEKANGQVIALEKRPFRACKSQFHLECITEYNCSGFDFVYAARIECQRRFFCPLHCCSVCNQELKKQSAYEAQLVECTKCFRAFHEKCCFPAGSKKVDVAIEFEKPATFQMIVCPSHCRPAPSMHHIPACCMPDCEKIGKLQECRNCIRSFHPRCRKVVQFNQHNRLMDSPKDLCDACLCEDVIVVGTPVIALCPGTNEFHMGKVHAATQLGAVNVEWLKHGLSIGTYEVGLSHVVEVQESYFRLAPNNQKSYWETTVDNWKEVHYARHPTVFKLAFMLVNASFYANGTQTTLTPKTLRNFCECGTDENCEDDCRNVDKDRECPPSCSQNKAPGKVCNNRKIATGFVNPNIRLEKAGEKGYGLFATGNIREGEFLAGFDGEILDGIEYAKRRAVKEDSGDQQCIEQFMDLTDEFRIDMSCFGSIARYANNSCENYNADFPWKMVCVGENKKGNLYEPRRYLVASKDIEKGKEVTISYGFINEFTGCFCDTCKPPVDPVELQWDKDAKDD